MPSLLSGSVLRSGGSGEFLKLADAMPQLPATETTLTGFTIATNEVLQTSYRSSLGFVEFNTASMWSALPEGIVKVLQTGTTYYSTSTETGTLVITGGLGVGKNAHIDKDIVVNDISIGAGWNILSDWQGLNNIVFKGTATATSNDFNNGQEAIAIGFTTLDGIETAYKVISIGRYAISSGTYVSESIAIGDSALKQIGVLNAMPIGNITSATQTDPVVIEVTGHQTTTGTYVYIEDVVGMTELNDNFYWVDVISNNELALYTNNILSTSLNGTGFTSYVSGGTVGRVLLRRNNIAIGNQAAEKFIDGEKNFFFGDRIAKNLGTGSNNIFIGSDVAANLTRASGTISIGSDNLVDDKNNQIAIGSVFYYDGTGTSNINANTEIGIGTQSTGTTTGGLRVIGGAGIQRNLYVGEVLHALGTSTFYQDLLPSGSVNIGSTSSPFNSLFLNGTTLYLSTVTLKSLDSTSFSVESPAGFVRQTVGNLTLNSGQQSTAPTNGSLVVSGGVGISGDVHMNGQLNVIGVQNVSLNPSGGSVYLQPLTGGTVVIEPSAQGSIDNMVIGASNPADATFDGVNVNATTQSTSTTTGALQVDGGVGIQGNVYAATGNPDENYMLYTPRSTVSATAPPNARVGDFWINPSGPFFLQYVNDGGNKIWVQI